MRDFDRAARGKGGADAVVALTGPEINMFNENYRLVVRCKLPFCFSTYNYLKIFLVYFKYYCAIIKNGYCNLSMALCPLILFRVGAALLRGAAAVLLTDLHHFIVLKIVA